MNFYDWKIWLFELLFFAMYADWKSKKNKGFNDMIYDIWFLMEIYEKYWFLRIVLGFCLSAWKLSLCVDDPAYVLPGKLALSNGF